MTDKELIRRALLGSREAQQECTEKGIVLPCPWCNCKTSDLKRSQSIEWYWRKCRFCGAESSAQGTKSKANLSWNTRPAPPVGRCKDCVWSREPTEEDYKELDRDLLSYKDSLVCDFWEREVWCKDFCSYFDKREG